MMKTKRNHFFRLNRGEMFRQKTLSVFQKKDIQHVIETVVIDLKAKHRQYTPVGERHDR